MFQGFSRLILIVSVFAFCAAFNVVHAQTNPASNVEQEDFPKGIKESLAKSRIEREKKDFEQLLQRGEEAAKLGDELGKSFAENKSLSAEDKSKLERLEKISKKIREELGGSSSSSNDDNAQADDKTAAFDESRATSLPDAVNKLKNLSAKLAEELKKTSRYTVSAVAIQSSNAVLKIVRFIRGGKN